MTFSGLGTLGESSLGKAYRDGMTEALQAWITAGWGPFAAPTKAEAQSLREDMDRLIEHLRVLNLGPFGVVTS